MSQTFKLYRLQQIDSQLDKMKARIAEIDVVLNDNARVRQAEIHTKQADADLQETRKALRSAEENVRAQRVKIEQTEATLYSGKVSNPKELQDLQNESAAHKRYLSVLEDRQLEAMMIEEESASVYQTASTDLDLVRQQFAEQHHELNDEKEKLQKDVVRFEGERKAAVSSIPATDMGLYNKIRRQRRGIAVAKVTDKACSACGTILSAALLHAARSPNEINICDTCSRILYVG